MICSGLYTASITPFDENGDLNLPGFLENLRQQEESKIDGIVLFGTTGESPSLDFSEKKALLKAARENSSKLRIIAGAGSSSTTQTIESIKQMADLGADSALIVSPYYNKPTQEGILRHFEQISKHSPLPVIIYNIQSRTGVNIETQTLKQISDFPKIIGVKESSGNVSQISEVIEQIKQNKPEFLVFSGDDALTFPILSLGADGLISVTSNIAPKLMHEYVYAALNGNFTKARQLHFHLMPLFRAIFWETNPIPIKAAMGLLGLAAGDPRLPMTPLSSHYLPRMKEILMQCECS